MNNTSQNHNFHVNADVDWFRIEPVSGTTYTITTSNLISTTDTIMHLYDSDGITLLAVNDDYPGGGLASRIVWTASHGSPYYVRVRDFYWRGDCLGYTITGQASRYYQRVPIPVPGPFVTPTPTPSGTPTRTPTRTPTATRTRTPTPTVIPTIVAPTPIPVPGLNHPKGLAVNSNTHLVYITGRDNNRLYLLDGVTTALINQQKIGREPWGVAVNPNTNKVYVAHFASGDVYVLNATTLAVLSVIPVGPNPTFVAINLVTNRIFVPTYGNNGVVVINGSSDTIERIAGGGGIGTWGIAVNPNLNRVYVSNRDAGNVTTLDGNNNYQVIEDQTIKPCGQRGSPYGLNFNRVNNKLYVACAPAGEVNQAAIYHASPTGLSLLAVVNIGNGGRDGGGGIAIDTATGNAFFTNSVANTVSVIGGNSNAVVATVPVGANPFGAAADSVTRRVFVGNRDSNN
jgi:YVTN family beta-propeller protein